MSFLKKIVGSRNDRILKNYRKTLNEINLLSEEIKKIKDTDFQNITNSLKKKNMQKEKLWTKYCLMLML